LNRSGGRQTAAFIHRNGGALPRRRYAGFAKSVGGRIEQPVAVLQFVFGEPVGIGLEQEREVVEFVLEFAAQIGRADSARSLAGVN